MQTELNKTIQNSEESQLFLYKKSVSPKKSTLKVLYWVKIVEPHY